MDFDFISGELMIYDSTVLLLH